MAPLNSRGRGLPHPRLSLTLEDPGTKETWPLARGSHGSAQGGGGSLDREGREDGRVGAGAPGLRVPGGAAPLSRPRVQSHRQLAPRSEPPRREAAGVCTAFK